jgi:hypothetical protein
MKFLKAVFQLLIMTLITSAGSALHAQDKADTVIKLNIQLRNNFTVLQGITVRGKKERIEIDNNKLVLNVQNSALNPGKSALDLLKQVPGIGVGQDDELLLKGSAGINVLVDGKMTYMAGKQLSTFLQGLNAEDIARIELSATPSAQFDAAGNAGVVNIVMRKNRRRAYALELRSAVTKGHYWMVNENITASVNTPKLNVFGSLDYNTPHRVQRSKSSNTIVEAGQSLALQRANESTHKIKFYTYRAGAEWQLLPGHRMSAFYHGYLDDFASTNYSNQYKYAGTRLAGFSRSLNALTEPYHYNAINLNYTFDIDSTGKTITADAHYINYRNFSDGLLSSLEFDAYGNSTNLVNELRSHQPGFVKIRSVKADVALPYKALTVKAGIKYADVSNDNNFRFDSLQGSGYVTAESMSNHFRYSERIAAAYMSFSKKIGKTTLELGLRNEYTEANGYTVRQDIKNKWEYNKVFPSLFIGHAVNDNNKLSASVSRRINRPVYTNLNPVRWYVDKYFYYSGNPELVPEMAWVFSTSYTFNRKYVLTASYNQRDNYNTRRLLVDETGAVKSQSANFRYMRRFDMLLSAPLSIGSFWDLQFTGYLNHTSYPIFQPAGFSTASRWAGSMQLQQQMRLPWQLHLEVASYYYTKELYGVYVTSERFYCDAGLKRSWLKDKLTVQCSFSDFFRTNRYQGVSQTAITDYRYYDRPDTHRFGLSVRYQMGGKLINKKGSRLEEQERL